MNGARLLHTVTALMALMFGAAVSEAAPFTIAVTPSLSSLPVDVAKSQGYFTAEGLDVRIVDCTGGPVCMKQLFDGGADAVTVTELPVVMAAFERQDFAIVSTIASASGNIRILARKSAGIRSAKDLVGKRIGAALGTSSHYYLDAFLLFHDIDPKQTTVVPLALDQVVPAMESGKVDAVAGYTRHTSVLMKGGKFDGLFLDDPRIYSETHNLVITRRVLAQREGDAVKVLRALGRAQAFIEQNANLAKQIVAARTDIAAPVLDAMFPNYGYRLSLNQSLIAAMAGEARWALREGHVKAKNAPNPLLLVDDRVLRQAVPAALSR